MSDNWEFIAALASRDSSFDYSKSDAQQHYGELIQFSRSHYCPSRVLKTLVFAQSFIGRFLALDESSQEEVLRILQKPQDEEF